MTYPLEIIWKNKKYIYDYLLFRLINHHEIIILKQKQKKLDLFFLSILIFLRYLSLMEKIYFFSLF